MKKRIFMFGLTGAMLAGFSTSLFAIPVGTVVPGTADIFSAGQNANGGFPGGGTYAVQGVSFQATGGQVISFGTGSGNLGITGTTSCSSIAPCNALIGADGASLTFPVGASDGTNIPTASVGTGISGIIFTGREMFLVGVFLSDAVPS